ncbi:hypothetical protein B0J14DRAFT_158268 [Halenospora varia]|nr:hypothetical protein B0J14DRAFT_158268 [Halenospora varia]
MRSLPVVFGLLQLSIRPSLAFFRTAPDLSPFSYPYTALAGSVNVTGAQVTPNQPVNSHWAVYYISATNGHDYFICGQGLETQDNGILSHQYRVLITDITDKSSYGTAMTDPDATLSTDTFNFQSKGFKTYATTPDLFSTMVSISSVPNATFSLVSRPKGPNLYHAGSGSYFWGDDRTFEHAAPELYITGNLTYKGQTVDVIPEKSTGWYDRQYGPGYVSAGWNLFMFYLQNGVKGCVWHTHPVNGGPVLRMATVLFPDGHHEIYTVADDIHPAIPFTSKLTNATYYRHHQVHIIGLDTTLNFDLPVLGGEMTATEQPIPQFTLFEGYSDITGFFQGVPVKGFGVTEQSNPY